MNQYVNKSVLSMNSFIYFTKEGVVCETVIFTKCDFQPIPKKGFFVFFVLEVQLEI